MPEIAGTIRFGWYAQIQETFVPHWQNFRKFDRAQKTGALDARSEFGYTESLNSSGKSR